MTTQPERAAHFLSLHQGPTPLLLPNPWDPGSARLLASLGFEALATTSSGFAATLGQLDGTVTRDEALAHAAAVVAAVDVPVSADLERGFAREPVGVAETIRLALETGLAGCSIEDASGDREAPVYDLSLAAERVAAAAQVAHAGPVHLVLTARAENHLHGGELDDTIRRLQAYQDAGADVLYAPGVRSAVDIRRIIAAIDRPLNVLALEGVPPIAELAELGVARVSVGGGFAFAAVARVVEAARELREQGTYGFAAESKAGAAAARNAFKR